MAVATNRDKYLESPAGAEAPLEVVIVNCLDKTLT